MPQIAACEDVAADRVIRNRGHDADHPSADVYPLIGRPKDDGRANAFLVRYVPGTTSSTHYHAADQMQIIVEGKGRLGHHDLTPYQVHFSRAYTPYGPLLPDAQAGWAFVNLRTRPDPGGAQRLSVAREKLFSIPNRRPFQITCTVNFPPPGADVASAPIEGLQDDEGLSGLAVTLAPHARLTAPAAAGGDGQYVVAVRGSLVHDGQVRNALAVVHVAPDEPPFELQAGPDGLQAMIVGFPRVAQAADGARDAQAAVAADGGAADKLWKCLLCDFMYDEAAGLPDEGIAPGTRWQDVPDSWTCPDCGVTKADFVMVEF